MPGRMNAKNSKSSGAGARRGFRALLLCGGAMAAVAFTPATPMYSPAMSRGFGHTRGEIGRLWRGVGAMHCRRGEAMLPPTSFASSPRRGGRLAMAAMTSADDSMGGEEYDFKRKSGEGKKILVAGGAGYIGTHLCADLLMHDYEVCILDNFVNSSPLAVERVEMLAGKKVKVYEADTRDYASIINVFEEEASSGKSIEAVVHLAGLKAVGESVEKPHMYYDNNVVGSINLVRAMDEAGCKNLVFSSSATVYGDARSSPIKECHPLSATSPYGRSKLYIEEMLRDTVVSDGDWSVAILRYFNPVGAHPSGMIGEDPKGIPNNLMPFVTKVALGVQPVLKVFGNDYPTKDGTGVRDYLHVCDLASGHLAAIEKLGDIKGSDVFNLGTGHGISVLEMVRAFESASGAEVPYDIVGRRSGDVAVCFADPTKAEEGLGWTAKLGLANMCTDLWRWTERNPKGYAIEEHVPHQAVAHARDNLATSGLVPGPGVVSSKLEGAKLRKGPPAHPLD